MTKKMILIIVVMAISILAFGCSSKEAKDIDINGLAQNILDSVAFQDELTAVDDFTINTLYAIEEGLTTDQSVYVSSGATAEEVAVFTCADEDSAAAVKEAAQQRIADMQEGFADYNPAEMDKLNDPVLMIEGKYVILCISDDSGQAQSVIEHYIQEQ